MKRYACVWFPTFQVDRMRRASFARKDAASGNGVPHDQPFALVESGPHGIAITAVNKPAVAGGVHVGLMLADARAVVPGLLTRVAEPDRDQRMLRQLALWLGRYGPSRNVEGSDGLWVDISGVAHLFGDEAALAKDCVARLRRAGFQARVAIADTRSAAHALSRHGRMIDRVAIAEPSQTRAALADLPVESLQIASDLVILLRRLGLKRVGQLYPLPRAALARRFREAAPKITRGRKRKRMLVKPVTSAYAGWAEALVMRLDQALGDLSEPARGIVEPPVYRVQRAYAEPLISHDGILAALDDLAVELCVILGARDEGARALQFAIYRADGTSAEVAVRTSRPACEAQHIVELFHARLERIDAGLGLDAVVLEAKRTERLEHEQVGFAKGAAQSRNDPAVFIDRLSNRLGSASVFHLEEVESHIPERAERRVAALARRPRALAEDQLAHAAKPLRPAFLLEPAEAITVVAEVPDGPPARFTWRRVTRRVVRAEGPERIAPEWWRLIGQSSAPKPARRMRDYYRVEDEHGGAYWIYRAGLYPVGLKPMSEPSAQLANSQPANSHHGETTDHPVAQPTWYLQGLF